jgi:hypothetical protein
VVSFLRALWAAFGDWLAWRYYLAVKRQQVEGDGDGQTR